MMNNQGSITRLCRRCLDAVAFAAGMLLLTAAAVRAETAPAQPAPAQPGPAKAEPSDVALVDRIISIPRHRITLDNAGLPSQWEIRPVANDIPLAWRAQKEWPPELLKRIGRGPQLVAPARIDALIDDLAVAVTADAPAELRKTDKGVEAVATWSAGGLKGRMSLFYAADGSVTGQLTFNPKGVALGRMDLVLELSGTMDTAIVGNAAEFGDGKPLPLSYGNLDSKPGMLWCNGAKPSGDGALCKGAASPFFLGNGDRGFTWLAHAGAKPVIGGDEPSISVERNREGAIVWRMALLNKASGDGESTVGFTLLAHPARLQPADRRIQQWQTWSEKAVVPALTAAARSSLTGDNLLVRAEAGSVYEGVAARVLLEGPAGGDAPSAAATLADRFPIGLFRYLSASHTGLAAQLRPNNGAVVMAGGSPAPDRMALGRALLHDIGVDVSGLAGRASAATVLRALDEFGYFHDDGKTEFLPYWRTAGIFQYGPEFEGDNGFAVTKENPTARMKVSAFIRPTTVEIVKKRPVIRHKTLFVLVNEGTTAVREYILILNPQYLFGGPNRLQAEHIYSQLDFSDIAPDGDWQRGRVERTLPEMVKNGATMGRGSNFVKSNGNVSRGHMSELMDLETGGIVRLGEKEVNFSQKYYGDSIVKNGFQLYGPIYVPPRSMRLIYGAGREELPNGVAGRVVDRKTGEPLSVPVHIFKGKIKKSATIEPGKKGPYQLKDVANCLATVQADKDGKFRWSGFQGGTVLAEVNGKMFPTRPQITIRNDGVVISPEADSIDEPSDCWTITNLRQSWPNNRPDDAAKWVDVIIEVDLAEGP